MEKRRYKCALCGETTTDIDYYCVMVGKQKRYVHNKCREPYKLGGLSDDKVDDIIVNIIKDKRKEVAKQRYKRNIEREDNSDRGKFVKYIQDTYDIKSLPSSEYVKFASIINGTYKGLKEGISYKDLLFMFQKQYNNLNKIYQNNIAKGKEFKSNINRFDYDLAIIINKYDSYKKWKQKQEIIEADIKVQQEKQNEINIDYSKIKDENRNNNDEIDICDILDDIY